MRAPTTFIILVATAAVHFIFREAVFERATVRSNQLLFPPVFILRAVFWLGIPVFSYGAYKVASDIHNKFDLIFPIIYILLDFLVFFSYPGTINLTGKGIEYHRYFGFVKRRMGWEEITTVAVSPIDKSISVYSREGNSIVHTQFNVDPIRFETEVRDHLRPIGTERR